MVVVGLSLSVVRIVLTIHISRETVLILAGECLLVSDNNMDDFKVFHNGMEVGEMDATTCEIATEFILTIQNINGVVNGTAITLYRRRYRPELEIIGI